MARQSSALTIPASERARIERILLAESRRYGMTPSEYLRKIWYHEQAAKLGEYVASWLMNELLQIAPYVLETPP